MAKRFRFRLQTLLRVRELREREARRRVAAQRAQIAQIDEWNRQTANDIADQQDSLRAAVAGGRIAPTELARTRAWIAHLRSTIAARSMQKSAMLTELEKLQEAWRETRQQMRIIEKLREKRWAEYVHERGAEEQAASDELAQQLHGLDWL